MDKLMDYTKPPSRMAELYVAIADAAKLGEPPEGDVVVYHGTDQPYIGPPVPHISENPGRAWSVPGVFASNDPESALRYVSGLYYLDGEKARRLFASRFDPERAYQIEWQDRSTYMKSLPDAKSRLYRVIEREKKKRGGGELGWERFKEEYDVILPPPYEEWDRFGDKDAWAWQAILLNPRFDDVYLPNPGVDDFTTFRRHYPFERQSYESVGNVLDWYAEDDGEGGVWARDIAERARQTPASRHWGDSYRDIQDYQDYAARSLYLNELAMLKRHTADTGHKRKMRTLESELESEYGDVMKRITPPTLASAGKRATLYGPEKGTDG